VTCSSTCRQRLRRGGAFAYLAKLTAKKRQLELRRHGHIDARRRGEKEARAGLRRARDERRKAKVPGKGGFGSGKMPNSADDVVQRAEFWQALAEISRKSTLTLIERSRKRLESCKSTLQMSRAAVSSSRTLLDRGQRDPRKLDQRVR
jgi:hypothetical protein